MDSTQAQQQLQDLRTVLEERISAIQADRATARSNDSEERATEAENDESLDEIDAQSRAELASVLHALAKIQAGTYGTCDRCGEDIAPGRLEAVPFAATCIGCADPA